MTPHREPLKAEVGVRDLHDRLSRYVQHVQDGADLAFGPGPAVDGLAAPT